LAQPLVHLHVPVLRVYAISSPVSCARLTPLRLEEGDVTFTRELGAMIMAFLTSDDPSVPWHNTVHSNVTDCNVLPKPLQESREGKQHPSAMSLYLVSLQR
jgi:hypothetical protein